MEITTEDINSKSRFVQGAINPGQIAKTITACQSNILIGGHNIFLGQVRSDIIGGKHVMGIDYSAHVSMAEKVFGQILASAFDKFDLVDAYIHHSLGLVKSGEICLFVLACTGHRDESYVASRYIVEEIKANSPIFGKEMFEDDSYVWKENK